MISERFLEDMDSYNQLSPSAVTMALIVLPLLIIEKGKMLFSPWRSIQDFI
jgi:hypothetical protein